VKPKFKNAVGIPDPSLVEVTLSVSREEATCFVYQHAKYSTVFLVLQEAALPGNRDACLDERRLIAR